VSDHSALHPLFFAGRVYTNRWHYSHVASACFSILAIAHRPLHAGICHLAPRAINGRCQRKLLYYVLLIILRTTYNDLTIDNVNWDGVNISIFLFSPYAVPTVIQRCGAHIRNLWLLDCALIIVMALIKANMRDSHNRFWAVTYIATYHFPFWILAPKNLNTQVMAHSGDWRVASAWLRPLGLSLHPHPDTPPLSVIPPPRLRSVAARRETVQQLRACHSQAQPSMPSLVTSACSRSSLHPSVPSGLRGTTMYLKSAVESCTRSETS
jgi:hypothetical protein